MINCIKIILVILAVYMLISWFRVIILSGIYIFYICLGVCGRQRLRYFFYLCGVCLEMLKVYCKFWSMSFFQEIGVKKECSGCFLESKGSFFSKDQGIERWVQVFVRGCFMEFFFFKARLGGQFVFYTYLDVDIQGRKEGINNYRVSFFFWFYQEENDF